MRRQPKVIEYLETRPVNPAEEEDREEKRRKQNRFVKRAIKNNYKGSNHFWRHDGSNINQYQPKIN